MPLKRLTAQLLVLSVAFVFALSVNYLHAWTPPPANPPSGNVAAPINEGSTAQTKNGILGANALAVFGDAILSGTNNYLNFGSTAGSSGYGFRNNNGTVEYKNSGGSWGGVGGVAGGGGALGLSFSKYMQVQEQYNSGTNGPFIPNAWTKRSLNTVVTNTISGASLASNQITLPAGTYYIEVDATMLSGGPTRNALYNVTDATYAAYGINGFGNGGGEDQGSSGSPLAQTFTISAQKVFEFRSRTSDSGYCYANAYSVPEICSDVRIWKLD